MSKEGNNLLFVFVFLVLSSCSLDFKIQEDERSILFNTIKNLNDGISLENSLTQKSNNYIWDEILLGGNKPKDIEIGVKADSVFEISKQYFDLQDSLIDIIQKGQKVNLSSKFQNYIYDFGNRLFSEEQNRKYKNEIIRCYHNNPVASNSSQFQNELGLQFFNNLDPDFQRLNLESYSHLLTKYIQLEMNEISANFGSSCCFCFQLPILQFIHEFEIVDSDSLLHTRILINSFPLRINKHTLTYEGVEIKEQNHTYTLKIPITNQPKGPNKYQLLVKSKYHNREVVDTLTGYYVVR